MLHIAPKHWLPHMPPASAEKEETISHIFWHNDSLKSFVQICNIYIYVLCAILLKNPPKSSERKCSPVQIDILCGSEATDMGKPQTCGIITSSLTAIIAVVLKYKYKYKYKYKKIQIQKNQIQ